MQLDFTDKRVLVTGSTRGIGRAAAEHFLEAGARVAVNGRTAQSVDAAISEMKKGNQLFAAPGDIGTVEGCEETVNAALDHLGGLDILVNSAGVCRDGPIEESDEAVWNETININLRGTFFCSRAALRALRASQGNIVNVGSDAGLMGSPNLAVYCASKGGVVNMTRAMALELAPEVRVNCVCPGYVDTDMVRCDFLEKAKDPKAAEQEILNYEPMKRMAKPVEVAQIILYLASPAAGFVTGAARQVDGGSTAGH